MLTILIDPAPLVRLVQFLWLAVITGVGGGTVRDLILSAPVFWVQNPVHVAACLVTAVVMHFVAPRVESRYRTLLWFDAHEIYVTASVLGACAYVVSNGLGLERLPALLAGFAVTFIVRGLAIRFGWSLPVFRESATRDRWKNERKDGGPR